jgi:hypothetical protein
MADPDKPGGSFLMALFLFGLVAVGLAVSLAAPFGQAAHHEGPAAPPTAEPDPGK